MEFCGTFTIASVHPTSAVVSSQCLCTAGAILPCRITLGGRLCTTTEVHGNEQTTMSEIEKDIRVQLNATIQGGGAGFDTGMTQQRGST